MNRIPTRFNITGQARTPSQRFLDLVNPQAYQRPEVRMLRTGPSRFPEVTSGPAIPQRMPTQAQPMMPLQRGVMSALDAGRYDGVTGQRQEEAPQQSQSDLMKALYADPTSARGRALQAAAATGLQLSGYQDRPMTTGQILGAMMQAGMGEYQAQEAVDRQLMLEMAKLGAKKPDLETLYDDMGGSYKAYYDPKNPNADEFGYVRVSGSKPPSGMSVTVDPETGAVSFTQGVGVKMEKSTKKGIEDTVQKLTGRMTQLDDLSRTFDPSFLQIPKQLEMLGYSFGERMDLFTIPDNVRAEMERYSRFRAGTQELFSEILKDLSGAAVTKFELDNAKTFLPAKEDSPTQYQSKLRRFTATTSAALFRAQNLLSGDDTMTGNLARKYPLSITKKDKTLYIHEYVNMYLDLNENATQKQALESYAQEVAND